MDKGANNQSALCMKHVGKDETSQLHARTPRHIQLNQLPLEVDVGLRRWSCFHVRYVKIKELAKHHGGIYTHEYGGTENDEVHASV